jgi:hypothetical protein
MLADDIGDDQDGTTVPPVDRQLRKKRTKSGGKDGREQQRGVGG